MNRFSFAWIFPFTPGIFELILFALVMAALWLLNRIGWSDQELSSFQKLLIFLAIFISMGLYWTWYFSKTLSGVPWAISAAYLLAIIVFSILWWGARSYGLAAVCVASLPVMLICLNSLSTSSIEIDREGVINPKSFDYLKRLRAEREPSEMIGFLNGYTLAIQLTGANQWREFSNQGFATKERPANTNHLEILEKLEKDPSRKRVMTFKLRYSFGALDETTLVAIDDDQFDQFYYAPLVSGQRDNYDWFPNVPRYAFKISLPFIR